VQHSEVVDVLATWFRIGKWNGGSSNDSAESCTPATKAFSSTSMYAAAAAAAARTMKVAIPPVCCEDVIDETRADTVVRDTAG